MVIISTRTFARSPARLTLAAQRTSSSCSWGYFDSFFSFIVVARHMFRSSLHWLHCTGLVCCGLYFYFSCFAVFWHPTCEMNGIFAKSRVKWLSCLLQCCDYCLDNVSSARKTSFSVSLWCLVDLAVIGVCVAFMNLCMMHLVFMRILMNSVCFCFPGHGHDARRREENAAKWWP